MYDCDKGYILSEKGPVGATCVGGLWRPTDLPKCLPGLHPRLRWTRRKRGAKSPRSGKFLRNFSQFKREMSEILRKDLIDDPFPMQKVRTKRSWSRMYDSNDAEQGIRKIHRKPVHKHALNHKWRLVAPAIMRFRRNSNAKRYPDIAIEFARTLRNDFFEHQRDRFEEEQQRAYNKYYEKIKQKHRNYINSLLRASNSQSINDNEPLIFENQEENAYRNGEMYKTPSQDPFDEINAYSSMPIPLPNINENRNVYTKKQELPDGIVNNTFVGRGRETARIANNRHQTSNEFLDISPKHHENNVTNILELLRSQIVRRRKRILRLKRQHLETFGQPEMVAGEKFHRVKRSPRSPNQNQPKGDQPLQDEDGRDSDTENTKKSRPKEPCEVSLL